jgi:ribosomal protein S8
MEFKRHNFKWNINETLRLQREFELLELTIQDIAIKHGRTTKAILYKLEKEGFIKSWSVVKGIEEYIENDDNLREHKSLILDDNTISSVSSSNKEYESGYESSDSSYNTPENNNIIIPNEVTTKEKDSKMDVNSKEKNNLNLMDYLYFLHVNLDMLFILIMCYVQNFLFRSEENEYD